MPEVTDGAVDIANAGKKHYVWLLVFLVIILALAVRYYANLAAKLTKLPPSVKGFLRVTGLLLPFGLAFLLASSASASTCCSIQHVASHGYGWLTALAGLATTIGFGVVALGAPDTVDAKTSNGQKVVTFDMDDSTVDPSIDFYVDGSQNLDPTTGRPLCVLDDKIELTATVNNPSTGTAPIYDDDQPSLLGSLQITNPLVGTILDATSGTGPFVKLMEFFGLGFNRSDAPVATVLVPETDSATATYTRTFTVPRAQRFMNKPSKSAPWLALYHNTDLRISLAKSAVALASVSTGATVSGNSTLKVSTVFAANHDWEAPMIARYWRETPVGGSNAVTLRRFGEADPAGTAPTDLLFLIAQLSSLKGLGGNQTLDAITQINVPKLNLARVENILQFVGAKLDAQYGGGHTTHTLDGNYQMGAVANGDNRADLLWLPLKQPGQKMVIASCLAAASGSELAVTESLTGANPTGQYAFALGSLRHLNNTALAQLIQMSGGRVPANRSQKRTAGK